MGYGGGGGFDYNNGG